MPALPPSNMQIAAYVRETPKFEIIDGMVHITQRYSDNLTVERVMRLNLFLRTIANAQKAVREYEARGHAEIVPFRRKKSG